MDYFYGLLTMAVFFVALLFFFWLGTRYGKKTQPPPIEDERKREIERYNKHFKALFNYDVDKALQRKKVT